MKRQQNKDRLPLVSLKMGKEEIKSLKEVVDSGWVTQGPKVLEFEKAFSSFVGTKYAVATSSCTAALQIVLSEMELSQEDEVITTPFTWESTISAILYANATPVFADINLETFNIDPNFIEKVITKKTKGIVIVHYAGLPCNIEEIRKIVTKNDLFLIEDSAHALGSQIDGQKIGSFGDAACFSFGSTKTITTGEGGMITTSDKNKYERYKILRNYGENKASFEKRGISRWDYDITMLSFNFKMNEFAAAIGIEQVKKLPKIISERIGSLNLYQSRLIKNKNVLIQKTPSNFVQVPIFFPICLDGVSNKERLEIMTELEEIGIETMIYYPPVYELSIFKKIFANKNFDCPVAERVSRSIFSVPCHDKVSEKHVKKINRVLEKHLT